MSKCLSAKQFENEYQFDSAKKEERKKHKKFRDQRKYKKNTWQEAEY